LECLKIRIDFSFSRHSRHDQFAPNPNVRYARLVAFTSS
jgi:hypothetical protein